MKRVLLVLLTLVSTHYVQSAVVQDPTYPTISYNRASFPEGLFDKDGFSKLATEECLVTFDINDVIFLRDYSVVWTEIKRIMKKQGFRYGVKVAAQLLKTTLYKGYLNYLYTKQVHDPRAKVWDYYLESLLEKARTPQEKEHILLMRVIIQKLNIINTPVIGMVQELQQQGHKTVALTNMGSKFLAVQLKLLKEKLTAPNISEVKAARISTVMELLADPSSTRPCPENNWCYKPQPEMYQLFFDKNKEHSGHFIFIDDSEENLTAALENGFHIGIKFTSAEELEEALQALGLLRY